MLLSPNVTDFLPPSIWPLTLHRCSKLYRSFYSRLQPGKMTDNDDGFSLLKLVCIYLIDHLFIGSFIVSWSPYVIKMTVEYVSQHIHCTKIVKNRYTF